MTENEKGEYWKMPFLDFFKQMQIENDLLSHNRGSDGGYRIGRDIISLIITRFVQEGGYGWDNYYHNEWGNHFRLDEKIIDGYSLRSNDRSKEQTINEFRKELSHDIHSFITYLEMNDGSSK